MMVREWARQHLPQPESYRAINRRRLEWQEEEMKKSEEREREAIKRNWPTFKARPAPSYVTRRKDKLALANTGT